MVGGLSPATVLVVGLQGREEAGWDSGDFAEAGEEDGLPWPAAVLRGSLQQVGAEPRALRRLRALCPPCSPASAETPPALHGSGRQQVTSLLCGPI